METTTNSPKLSLNREDLKKIGKGAVMAILGALLTYVTQLLPNVDFGAWTPIVAATFSIAVNALHKYLSGPNF